MARKQAIEQGTWRWPPYRRCEKKQRQTHRSTELSPTENRSRWKVLVMSRCDARWDKSCGIVLGVLFWLWSFFALFRCFLSMRNANLAGGFVVFWFWCFLLCLCDPICRFAGGTAVFHAEFFNSFACLSPRQNRVSERYRPQQRKKGTTPA